MKYKYKKGQIFRKKPDVPPSIRKQIYNCVLSFSDFMQYHLEDKIPTSCLSFSDREIVEKFGIERAKTLDWELITKRVVYNYDISFRDILMSIDPKTVDINTSLYELVKDQIRPADYTTRMKEMYSDRLFEVDDKATNFVQSKMYDFNNGIVSLESLVSNWDLYKNKDFSYCLSHDKANTNKLTVDQVREFMNTFENISKVLVEHANISIYSIIQQLTQITDEAKKQEYVKQLTDSILTQKKDKWVLTNEEYKQLFKYSSLRDYLHQTEACYTDKIIEELKNLPKDYIFDINIPFTVLATSDVIKFIGIYGLKNTVDFDEECGHFFTKNNCKMLKLIYNMYLHYGGSYNFRIPNKFTPYTKDEFYEAIRKMILHGPTDGAYRNQAPDYRTITGEFRQRFSNLFISESAPDELQKAFYTKSVTPQLLNKHPEYVTYLKGKEPESYFEFKSVMVKEDYGTFSENFYKILKKKTDFNDMMNFISEYGEMLDIVLKNIYLRTPYATVFSKNDTIDRMKQKINDTFKKLVIVLRIAYPKVIPQDLIENYPSLFLNINAPKELQEAFYNRTINSDFILDNPHYQEYLKSVDLEIIYQYMPVKVLTKKGMYGDELSDVNLVKIIKDTFGKEDGFDVMIIYGKYIKSAYEYLRKEAKLEEFKLKQNCSKDELLDKIDAQILKMILDGKIKYDENIPMHFKNNNPTLFLEKGVSEDIRKKFYNREFTVSDFSSNPELLNILGNTNIACGFPEKFSWIIPLFNDSDNPKKANSNRLKLIIEYEKIQDTVLQSALKEYVMETGENINIENLEYVSGVISQLALSNSSEIFTFRKQLATQILKSSNPIEILNKIEDIFIKNNIPTVGKIYSCFDILHPDFQGFNFDNSIVSPVLKNASTSSKKIIVFSDLIKASFGSNNRSIKAYLNNIDVGFKLYESIRNGQIQYNDLDENQKQELITFSKHLATLYNNTMKAKRENDTFTPTNNVLEDILELSKKLSPNGTLDYNLGDRVIRMFCGFTGINTLEQAQNYVKQKVKHADSRNRIAAKSNLILEKGDFIKGIGDITYLGNILQNGSGSKEYLGASADSDRTPLDTDVSMILRSEGTIKEKINDTAAKKYGPIYFVLKNDERFITTREDTEVLNPKSNLSKMEVFRTGVLGKDHYGIRTSFASTEINYIVMENYNPRVGLEIAMNGFYIPVANMEGKIIFTPEDYDKLREKMNGLSYYEMGAYQFDNSINNISPELAKIVGNIESNKEETKKKSKLIYSSMSKKLAELNLNLTNKIDLKNRSVTLLNTGSTGRFTNLPGDGDFDFIMQVDRKIFENSTKMENLRKAIIQSFGAGNNNYDIVNGDIREFKTKVVDDDGIEHEVEIDITFVTKTDKTEYASDVCVSDRLNSMSTVEQKNLATANIILAKKLLKGLNAYKPARKDSTQGGMGGIGVENWILQNGGTLYSAAKSFVECANECESFEEFQSKYKLYNFGVNHMAEKRGQYPHDNYIENMNATGYQKMKQGLALFIKLYEENVAEPCLETIEKMKQTIYQTENVIDKYKYDSADEIMADTQQIIRANIQKDIEVKQTNMGQTGFMYQFSKGGKEYLVKAGVNKTDKKVRPARACVQEVASVLQKIITPSTSVDVKTFGEGNFRVSVQEKITNSKKVTKDKLIKEHTNELLGEYVCDYLLGNYDSDASNFIIDSNNHLRGIDKEQSFKYLLDSGSEEQQLTLDFSFSPSGSRSNVYPALIQHLQQAGLSEENRTLLNNILMNLKSISDEEYKNIFKSYAYAYDTNRVEEILSKILMRKKYFESQINEFIEQINSSHDENMNIANNNIHR